MSDTSTEALETTAASRYRRGMVAALLRRGVTDRDQEGNFHARTSHPLVGLTLEEAIKLYSTTDRSHWWSVKGLGTQHFSAPYCTRCRYLITSEQAVQSCPKAVQVEAGQGRFSNVCPLLLAISAYYDAALARVRFQEVHGRWPEPGEELLQWGALVTFWRAQ